MNYQRLSQTRTAKTNPQPQEKTRANYTPHPLEELQGLIGNRAMVRLLQQQRQEAEASGKLSSDSPRLRSIESYGQQSMLRKPLFRGLSHELMGNSQPQETRVQRQVIDGNANPAVEDKTDTPTQPPSRGIGKPLFRGLSHEWMQELQQQGTPVQTKLTLGKAGDKYEQEADAIADQVVNQINSPTPSTANQEDKENQPNPFNTETFPSENTPIAAKPNPLSFPTSLNPGETVSQPVEQGIQQARSGGVPLAEGIREPMEQAFGADFSGVRVHTDVQSDALNQSLSSRAFTTGQDIFFRQGEYHPGSRGGQELLAHELTHVVQQKGQIGNGGKTMLQRVELNGQAPSKAISVIKKAISNLQITIRVPQGQVQVGGQQIIDEIQRYGEKGTDGIQIIGIISEIGQHTVKLVAIGNPSITLTLQVHVKVNQGQQDQQQASRYPEVKQVVQYTSNDGRKWTQVNKTIAKDKLKPFLENEFEKKEELIEFANPPQEKDSWIKIEEAQLGDAPRLDLERYHDNKYGQFQRVRLQGNSGNTYAGLLVQIGKRYKKEDLLKALKLAIDNTAYVVIYDKADEGKIKQMPPPRDNT